jgi:prepilin-type N-terminal cleavage/methylation domain-containing protein
MNPSSDQRTRQQWRSSSAVPQSGEPAFTLVELLVVISILGILVSIVSVSVMGMMGRGAVQACAADERTIQTVTSTFYADMHCFDGTDGWNEGNCTAGHYFPTHNGRCSDLRHREVVRPNADVVWELWNGNGTRATTDDIKAAAIWMGLLVHEPGYGLAGQDVAPGDGNSPGNGQPGPYLNEAPESCSQYNSSEGHGSYTWIVGTVGRIYGAFEEEGVWYAGFSGGYP